MTIGPMSRTDVSVRPVKNLTNTVGQAQPSRPRAADFPGNFPGRRRKGQRTALAFFVETPVFKAFRRIPSGAAYPNRTDDLLFTRQLLYQLS